MASREVAVTKTGIRISSVGIKILSMDLKKITDSKRVMDDKELDQWLGGLLFTGSAKCPKTGKDYQLKKSGDGYEVTFDGKHFTTIKGNTVPDVLKQLRAAFK